MRWILALSLAMGLPVHAQTGEVVQATPPAEAVAALNRHLSSLSRNPQDVNALLGAGQAALDLGDIQAANGFFTRANMVDGRNGRAKLGLAIVQIALKQPADAAANFDAAAALGVGADGHLSDRGLAYDLTGQQAKAQQDYRAVLQTNPADAATRLRYAVSLGISGNWAEADQQIQPALAESDREAWRMRAFIFAMNGRLSDARTVTQSIMPKGLADALDPYLQRLPLLDAAQKAAAVHYGEYPATVLRQAPPEPGRTREPQAVASTTREPANRRERRPRTSAAERRAAQQAAREAARQTPAATPAAPQPAAPQPATPAPATQPAATPPAASPPPTRLAQSQQPAAGVPLASTSSAPVAVAAVSPVRQTPGNPQMPSAAPAPSTPVEPPRSLASVVQALQVSERQPNVAVANLDTVARIQEQRRAAAQAAAAKEKAQADAAAAKAKLEAEARAKADAARKAEAERKAKLAANPSRNWVQIAAGRDVDALAFDLRRLRRTYGEAIAGQDGWTAVWGETRRLLVGPYRRAEDARAVVAELKKAGGDAFFWQSEAGEEVVKIGGK